MDGMDEKIWQGLIKDYEEHLKAEKDLADLTIRNYKTDLEPLYQYIRLKNISGLDELNKNNLRGYLARPAAPNTVIRLAVCTPNSDWTASPVRSSTR